MSIGKNIAQFRKNKGYTQDQLGQRLGVTNQAVSKWESEISMPDVMLLPKIADVLEIKIDDLFLSDAAKPSKSEKHGFDMDNIHKFPKHAQSLIIDTMYNQSNLLNCVTWDFLKTTQNPSTKKYDRIKDNTTLCCISDVEGVAFVSDTLTIIDSGTETADTGEVFKKTEIALGMKKMADLNVRKVLSYICCEYFHSTVPFNLADPEYFEKDINPGEISRSVGLTDEEALEVLEKLASLHIIDIKMEDDGVHYMLQKIKAVETAVTFRLIERLIHNQFACGCGDFLTLISE